MIQTVKLYETTCLNPYENLATEEALLLARPEGEAALFLWQNRHTVVIGAGQNAWCECDVARLEAEGGTLARRTTGGGAVYHDLGNLNFSFLMPRADYDVSRQLDVVRQAVSQFGIHTEKSGRNDLQVEGRKFSGNAFRLLKDAALHHGTLLVRADMAMLGRYLTVSPEKLQAKGVKSVPARVANLSDYAPVGVDDVKDALYAAFQAAYGPGERLPVEAHRPAAFDGLFSRNQTWAYNLGRSPAGALHVRTRLSFGEVELFATLREGALAALFVNTDAMDETLGTTLAGRLDGVRFERDALCRAIGDLEAGEIAAWLGSIAG